MGHKRIADLPAIGGSKTEIKNKVTDFFNLPGVSDGVLLLQIVGTVAVLWFLGIGTFKAAIKKDWKNFFIDLLSMTIALYVIWNIDKVFGFVMGIVGWFSK